MEGNDLLYDHYKESFSLSKEAQSRRNKYFLILCLLEALSFGFLTNPQMVIELFNKGIKSYLEITLPFEIHILQTLLWVLVIYVLIRYIQDVLYIERQYGYLEKLEKEIDCILGKRKIFCREGLAYRDEYPMVLNIITLFYKTMMPLLFTGINTVRMKKPRPQKPGFFSCWSRSKKPI